MIYNDTNRNSARPHE